MSIQQIKKPDVFVSFFVFADMGEPMIVEVNGAVTLLQLQDISHELAEHHADIGFHEDGNYDIKCNWYQGQYDEYGRCELPPGWEFDLVKFTPLPTEA